MPTLDRSRTETSAPYPALRVAFVVVLSAGAAAVLVLSRRWLGEVAPPPLDRGLGLAAAYQVIALTIAACAIAAVRAFAPRGRRYLRRGDMRAPAAPARWLGIRPGQTWMRVGGSLAVVLSGLTALAVWPAVGVGPIGGLPVALLIAIPLAASNAAAEEAIYRVALVEALDRVLRPGQIAVVAALCFGGVHYFGVPGGPVGVLMAGALGWILARSVLDTGGAGWAWFLHFLIDVVIFTALVGAGPS
jgi:uncharacterized protein